MSIQSGSFKKAYFEITNVCNASCDFCPKNSRTKHFITNDEFKSVIKKLQGRAEYLYFHLMGEPLLHPSVIDFAILAKSSGFKVMITTNGILSKQVGIPLIRTGSVDKISISLHCYEANKLGISFDEYINCCLDLAEESSRCGTVCALRLWNEGVESNLNDIIIDCIKARFGDNFRPIRTGFCVHDSVYLEFGERFDWPHPEKEEENVTFCHALRNQIGILSDGTVVPCCLDSEGRINLGNIYNSTLDEILSTEKAKSLYNGFSEHKAVFELCRSCGFAKRFK